MPFFRECARGQLRRAGIEFNDAVTLEKTAFNATVEYLKSQGAGGSVEESVVSSIHSARVQMLLLFPEVSQDLHEGNIQPSEVSNIVTNAISSSFGETYTKIENGGILAPRLYFLRKLREFDVLDDTISIEIELSLLKHVVASVGTQTSARRLYCKNMRRILFNMKHRTILPKILSGMISVDEFVKMDHRGLWSEYWNAPENQAGRYITVIDDENECDGNSMLQCRKCKTFNVIYHEVQTRSADEPMTAKCYCKYCGHRWSQ